MKIIINLFTALVLTSILVTGCDKGEKLTPTDHPEDVKGDNTLPQGNHPYDAEILNLYKKYGTLFLYKYDSSDLYNSGLNYIAGLYEPAINRTTRVGLFDVPADENFVGQQLDMVKDLWLKYYPEALLKKGMPHKVYLVDSFFKAWPGPGKPSDNWPEPRNAFLGTDYFLVSWGSARLNTIADYEKYDIKSILNKGFLVLAHQRGLINRTSDFTASTNYGQLEYATYLEQGILDWTRKTPDADWDVYMETIVSNSYADLIAPGGVLNPAIDKKGVIRKKYNFMLAYFQTAFGVDLQAIGNAGK